MAGIAAVLAEARAAGLEVRAEADALVVRGPRRHDVVARQLLAEKPAVMELLAEEDGEVAWRVAVMRPQVPTAGAIPFLIARAEEPDLGCCRSCGDALPRGGTIRCRSCAQAAWRVLHDVREGVMV